jgi:uncharacterized protein (TIGR02186 family)
MRNQARNAATAVVLAIALFGTPAASHAELWLTAAAGQPQTAANETIRPPAAPPLAADGLPPEKVEADVSAHNIEITAGFNGHEIVVFGTVDYSRQPTPESGYYDVAVIVEGPPMPIIARSKSNVGGLWINTGSMLFDAVPSFYAVSTTRPLEEIADAKVLKEKNIGFDFVKMRPRQGRVPNFSPQDLEAYRNAVVRIKQREFLYPRQDFGVGFIGRSLFRTSMRLPANVPIGALQAHVYLFRDGALISSFTSPVKLERRGVEAFIHRFATHHSFLYGLITVLLAVGAGMAAATLFRRN